MVAAVLLVLRLLRGLMGSRGLSPQMEPSRNLQQIRQKKVHSRSGVRGTGDESWKAGTGHTRLLECGEC